MDGPMGTELKHMSTIEFNYCDELTFLDPKLVFNLHCSYLKAGAQLLRTNTFNCNSSFGTGKGSDYIFQLNKQAALLANDAKKAQGTLSYNTSVFGVLGPVSAQGEKSQLALINDYSTSVEGLLSGGVDGFIIETVLDSLELKAAIDAVRLVSDKPIMVSLYIQANGCLLSGETLTDLLLALKARGAIQGFGFNCIPFVDNELLAAFYSQAKAVLGANIVFSLHPNVSYGVELTESDFSVLAVDLARFSKNNKLSLVGGCCGTNPFFITELSKALTNSY